MPYRFVHAADIHLDSPLRSLALRDPSLRETIGNASRQAFTAVVDLCLEERVDAFVLSGDLYDGEQTSMKTARFLADQLKRLEDGGVRTFVIRGNHDALSKITRELVLPESAKVFGGRAEAIAVRGRHGGTDVVVHGISFAQPHAPDSLLPRYKAPVEGALNIGLMHTSLDGSPGHDHYAPCSTAELKGSGFSYWALGHVHRRSAILGRCTIVMPGMPQGRDIGEAGPKSVTLATVKDDGTVTLEERATSVAQFERAEVALEGVTEWREVVARIGKSIERTREGVSARTLIARVALRGATPLAWRIRRDVDLLRTEAERQAAATGGTAIDKLEIEVVPTSTAVTHDGAALRELRRLMIDEVLPSAGYAATMTAILEELRGQLPPECRHVVGDDEAALAAVIARVARAGGDDVLARLQSSALEEA